MLEREFRRVPRIVDVTSSGGTVKRYEIHPDPDRLKQFGITLAQLQTALHNANQNVGADVVIQGDVAMSVRSVGLFGGGEDPVNQVLGMKDPDPEAAKALAGGREGGPARRAEQLKEMQRRRLATAAAAKLREEENRRILEIRHIVVTSSTTGTSSWRTSSRAAGWRTASRPARRAWWSATRRGSARSR